MIYQFVTLDDAKAIAKTLTDAGIGGGVLPYNPATELDDHAPFQNTDPDRSGIYIPSFAPFDTPSQGDKKFYHFRFRNGAEGVNAALVKATMMMCPTRWPFMIAIDVQTGRPSY